MTGQPACYSTVPLLQLDETAMTAPLRSIPPLRTIPFLVAMPKSLQQWQCGIRRMRVHGLTREQRRDL